MFDGEDALGQVATMSLDNQRNLKHAIERSPVFMKVAEDVSGEMNQWAEGFFGRRRLPTGSASSISRRRFSARVACTSTTGMFR